MDYLITVKTGDRLGAGTDSTVSIKLIGKNGKETRYFELDKFFANDFEAGDRDEYEVNGKDVGEIVMASLTLRGCKMLSAWFLAKITIEKKSSSRREFYVFPCYRWIEKDFVVYEGAAILPNSPDNVEVLKQQRKIEVQKNRNIYNWGYNPDFIKDLPGFVAVKDENPLNLPLDVQFTGSDLLSLFSVALEDFQILGFEDFFEVFEAWDSLEDYRKLITPAIDSGLPIAAEYWRDDVWFGAQFLNGSNPEVIQKCHELPKNFPVQSEKVEKLLDRGYTLEKAIKGGLIYIVDYKILEDIPTMDKPGEKRYLTAPLGLFYLRKNDDLVPIAIQLDQQVSNENPIWYPSEDTQWDWLMAKLWLRCADTQYHQMISHLLRCHLMMEAPAVSAWRNLPSVHPVWKLLYPHTKGIMAINTLGRKSLIPEGGLADQVLSIGGGGHIKLMQKHYRSLTFDSFDLEIIFEKRDVKDLRKFYYREDATSLWNAIKTFVSDIINIYYKKDDDVKEDSEIQDWIRDLHENGYPAGSNNVDKNVPRSFENREKLIQFLTIIIFTCSCQHAAVNFSQMETYGFHPNSPSLMRQPPPKQKGVTNLRKVMDSLATKHQAAVLVTIMNKLTTIFPDEKFLGEYEDSLFTDHSAVEAMARFKKELEKISERIDQRNKGMITPYVWLNPTRIPNSIAI